MSLVEISGTRKYGYNWSVRFAFGGVTQHLLGENQDDFGCLPHCFVSEQKVSFRNRHVTFWSGMTNAKRKLTVDLLVKGTPVAPRRSVGSCVLDVGPLVQADVLSHERWINLVPTGRLLSKAATLGMTPGLDLWMLIFVWCM